MMPATNETRWRMLREAREGRSAVGLALKFNLASSDEAERLLDEATDFEAKLLRRFADLDLDPVARIGLGRVLSYVAALRMVRRDRRPEIAEDIFRGGRRAAELIHAARQRDLAAARAARDGAA